MGLPTEAMGGENRLITFLSDPEGDAVGDHANQPDAVVFPCGVKLLASLAWFEFGTDHVGKC